MGGKIKGFLVATLVVSLFANMIFFIGTTEDSNISAINETLRQKELEYESEILKLKNEKSEKQAEIATHLRAISELNEELSAKETTIARLQSKFDALRVPVDTNFVTLTECNDKFKKLSQDLGVCLSYGKETKDGLDLCLKKSDELELTVKDQGVVIDIQEKELTSQKNLTESVRLALKDTERCYKKKLRKKWITAGGVGIAVGILAGILLK